MAGIKTLVFLDLETTGLPHMEHNKTKITELCAIAVQADHIELGCFPRVHNKLSFCLNPRKLIQPESTDITGLSNELLEHQTSFTSDVVDILTKWLEASRKPVCLVAHNGDRFDYPILRAEVENVGRTLPPDLLCVDSLTAFRVLDQEAVDEQTKEDVPFELEDGYDEILCQLGDELEESEKKLGPEEVQKVNETTPEKQVIAADVRQTSRRVKRMGQRKFVSYKLQDVFKRMTDREPRHAHEAEGDVLMLVTCAAVLGERFVAYSNRCARMVEEIPPMRPGKRIGT